jgi:hypothetical protein
MKGDLHVHSRLSDGSLSIAEIFHEAARSGLDFLSITDHDTTAGVEESITRGDSCNITAIPGVEISAYDRKRGRKAHLLGYGFELPANAIEGLCGPTRAARDAMTRRQIEILRDAGYPISLEEVEEEAGDTTALYKQHIMAVLTRKGQADGIRGKIYETLFKNNGICSGEIEYPDIFDALKAIHADGGAAVLAHPGQFDSWELLDELAAAGLDGIEIFHPDHEFSHHCKAFSAALNHSRLILTGGSDYHGAYGRAPSLAAVRSPGGAASAIARRCLSLPRLDFSSTFHIAQGVF